MENTLKLPELIIRAQNAFGASREEWMKEKLEKYFHKPPYYLNAIQNNKPTILEGGRGTGKTTFLKCLNYEGQFALCQENIDRFLSNNYIGLYYKVSTNQASSFSTYLDDEGMRNSTFTNYFNLIFCLEFFKMLIWMENFVNITLTKRDCERIYRVLNVSSKYEADFASSIYDELENKLYDLQNSFNSVKSLHSVSKSFILDDALNKVYGIYKQYTPFTNKSLFLLIDEYENLLDYQQQIVNSKIKHATIDVTYKIGVRELGWRVKYALNESEYLSQPSDYELINIEKELRKENRFYHFANKIFSDRLAVFLGNSDCNKTHEIGGFFEAISYEEEALRLGIKDNSDYKEFSETQTFRELTKEKYSELYCYFIYTRSLKQDIPASKIVDEYNLNPKKAVTDYNNYKYDLLFKIRKGKPTEIKKYYAGWETMCALANGNLRYLMEIVYSCFEIAIQSNNEIPKVISAEEQTKVVIDFGRKMIFELEGLDVQSHAITKLLLGLGRVFQLLAESNRVAPEITQFSIKGQLGNSAMDDLVKRSVMNLVLVRHSGSKLNSFEIKDYDYSLHPVFAPYFGISYRKKRKIQLTTNDLESLISDPKKAIRVLLKGKYSEGEGDKSMHQLQLFNDLFGYVE